MILRKLIAAASVFELLTAIVSGPCCVWAADLPIKPGLPPPPPGPFSVFGASNDSDSGKSGIWAAAGLIGTVALVSLYEISQKNWDTQATAPHWTGCHIGAEAGFGWVSTDETFVVDGSPALSGTPLNNALAGATLGCDRQVSAWVVGVENDISWTGFKGSALDIQNPAYTLGARSTWLDTARGRIGYAFKQSLVYLTGGAAFADLSASEVTAGTPEETVTHARSGWTVGGGMEFLMTSQWSVKAEYLFIDYGNFTYNWTSPNYTPKIVAVTDGIVRAGLNYRFFQQ